MKNNESTNNLGLNTHYLNQETDTEVNDVTSNKDKELVVQEPTFPEFAEIDIPNHFSMKLGSYSLQSDQLVSIILGCYKKLDLISKKKRGNSYT